MKKNIAKLAALFLALLLTLSVVTSASAGFNDYQNYYNNCYSGITVMYPVVQPQGPVPYYPQSVVPTWGGLFPSAVYPVYAWRALSSYASAICKTTQTGNGVYLGETVMQHADGTVGSTAIYTNVGGGTQLSPGWNLIIDEYGNTETCYVMPKR